MAGAFLFMVENRLCPLFLAILDKVSVQQRRIVGDVPALGAQRPE
jgi:hypothetical protein